MISAEVGSYRVGGSGWGRPTAPSSNVAGRVRMAQTKPAVSSQLEPSIQTDSGGLDRGRAGPPRYRRGVAAGLLTERARRAAWRGRRLAGRAVGAVTVSWVGAARSALLALTPRVMARFRGWRGW